MNSISFPKMFNNSSTNVVEDRDATIQNLRLLFLSNRGEFFGDPYYGTIFKRLLFEQNNVILKDIVVDAIYTAILQFMPQIRVVRKDIEISNDGYTIYANIKAKNMLDFQTNMYTINLVDFDED